MKSRISYQQASISIALTTAVMAVFTLHSFAAPEVGKTVVDRIGEGLHWNAYRSHECGWRGRLRTGDPTNRQAHPGTIISVLVTLVITTLLALYLVEKLALTQVRNPNNRKRRKPDQPRLFNPLNQP